MGPLPFKADYQLRQGTDWTVSPPPWLPGGSQAMNFAGCTAQLFVYDLPVTSPIITVGTTVTLLGGVYLDTIGHYPWIVRSSAFSSVAAPVFQGVIGLVATQLLYELEITDPYSFDYILQTGFLYLMAPS